MGISYKVLGQAAPAPASSTITTKALTSNVATITTAAAHGFVVGQAVTVILTASDYAFDAVRTVATVPTSTTFTFYSGSSNVTSIAATGTVTGMAWTTLYTCPAITSAVVSTLVVTNRGDSAAYYMVATSATTSPEAKEIIVWNDLAAGRETVGLTLGITLDPTVKYLMVAASNSKFSFNAYGTEIT